jgi:hypothetical protein
MRGNEDNDRNELTQSEPDVPHFSTSLVEEIAARRARVHSRQYIALDWQESINQIRANLSRNNEKL